MSAKFILSLITEIAQEVMDESRLLKSPISNMKQIPQLPYELISKICFEMRGMEHPIAAAIKELKRELYQLEQEIYDEIVDMPVLYTGENGETLVEPDVDYEDPLFVQLVGIAANETRSVMGTVMKSLNVKPADRNICDHLLTTLSKKHTWSRD